jgi:hypothetical protein
VEKEVSTSTLVQILIQEATDNANLASFFAPVLSDAAGKNVTWLGTLTLGRL